MSVLTKIFGDSNERTLKRLGSMVERINGLESKFEAFSDGQLKEKTEEFKQRLKKGESLDNLLVEAFALVREAAKRTLNQRHFNVQLMGGIVLHQGKIAEMKTGEGKTLAATLPTYLNALEDKGVHIVTVNDYLARRDTVWMGQIYDFLGLSVGCLNHEQAFLYNPAYRKPDEEKDKIRDELGGFKVVEDFLEPCSRKQAYLADVTYGTNNEFGFDFLRDNMAYRVEGRVQRGFHFAILDEIDSILIDEARTPLIISAPDTGASQLYLQFAKIVPLLKPEQDYEVDEERKSVLLTEEGIAKLERILGVKNIYTDKGIDYLHHLEQALKAKVLFKKDRDYVVRDGRVIIVDEFTGRLMPGRRWSGGLHQAIEAKEGVEVQPESQTLATITFQNFFRLYSKLAGMTGTAASSAEEFEKVYKLEVVCIPTNKPMIRKDLPDIVYKNEKAKFRAIVKDIKERHEKGQPILIGTRSIEKNEYLAKLLETESLSCQVLNAKQHEKEAEIIAQAGRLGAITVATNMAGRGVDIILGGNPPEPGESEKIRSLGGLHVIGTERHEARRIDDQLRGRSGRQGDPGSSQFFLSLEDDLLRIFGGERIQSLMEKLNLSDDQAIEAKLISRSVEAAQAKIEGLHFDVRKSLLEYDSVLSKHRDVFYAKRKEVLEASDEEFEQKLVSLWEKQGLDKQRFWERRKELGERFLRVARILFLQTMDFFWIRHLEDMKWLQDSVRLQAYAKVDPLVSYKTEGYQIFQEMMDEIEQNVVNVVSRISKVERTKEEKPEQKEVKRVDEEKIGRNDPCPCGSGKKYKKCCWSKQN
jgi:preprotein translocase subunit SecA